MMKMTKEAFLEKLSKTADFFDAKWFLDEDAITLTCPDGTFCPITAVTLMEKGKYFHLNEADEAGKKLELHHRTNYKIQGAADWTNLHGDLRGELMRAVGLER